MPPVAPAAVPLLERYRDFLPGLPALDRIVSVGEGGTPLLAAPRLARRLGEGVELFLKVEGANPTGSFKDRGMTAAVSAAVARGARALVCASTGNTSASAAAFAARAGLTCVVLIPRGAVALGKLAQALAHSARVLAVEGNFDQALAVVRRLPERFPLTIVNSTNPDRLVGQMTVAYEVVDALGDAPEVHALPVGNAGNITATFRGYRLYRERGRARSMPRMLGFQAAGAAPLVLGRPVEDPRTVATAIKIGNPASWQGATEAVRESGGAIEAVTDDQILEAYRLLASEEGVFAEPASAASLAGVLKKAARGFFPRGSRVVLTLTGNGLKDPETAVARAAPPASVAPGFDEVCRALEAILGA
jgi:threonine synthase